MTRWDVLSHLLQELELLETLVRRHLALLLILLLDDELCFSSIVW